MPAIKLPPGFEKSTLGRRDEGDPDQFFAKNVGYGTNDMCDTPQHPHWPNCHGTHHLLRACRTFLPELTKEAILFNLELRFAVRPPASALPKSSLAASTAPFTACRERSSTRTSATSL